MTYVLKHDLPGLRKGAKLLFDTAHNMYYVVKDNYADYYWFSKHEVEGDKHWFKIKKFLTTAFFFIFSQITFCQDKGVCTYMDWDNKIQKDSAIKVKVAYQAFENGHVILKEGADSSILPFKSCCILPFKKIISYKPIQQ